MTDLLAIGLDGARWFRGVCAARIAASTKLVCYTIHANEGSTTVSQLARDAALAPPTVRHHIRKAVAAGLLEIVQAPRGGTVLFRFRLPPPETTSPVQSITLSPGTPPWEAWIRHYLGSIDTSEAAQRLRRARAPFTVPATWPPGSLEVFEADPASGMRLVNIPWGTPEHAAWLCHYRRTGRVEDAMRIDVATMHLLEPSRWPPLPEETAAHA